MSIQIANRIHAIKPSATLVVSTKATDLKAQGREIINLSVGEPDFDTPQHIKDAAIKAIQDGFTKYTAIGGTPGLKKAIVNKFLRENGLTYRPAQILASCGAKQSIFNLIEALINEGDEVIIPVPYWVSYPEMVILAGGKPVIVPTTMAQNFKLTPTDLQKAITKKTRLVVLNSPSNPSGMAYTKAELAALGEVLRPYPNLVIVSDDIYEHIIWNPSSFANIVNACPDLYDQTVVVNGVSKVYSMTGWRIGYAAGPEPLINAMATVQSQSTSNPASISQAAAEAALTGDQSFMATMLKAFRQRHDAALEVLNGTAGIQCLATDGTFYLFPCVKEVIKRLPGINNDVEFCEYLLNQAGVAVVPGTAFGAPGFIRISIAVSLEPLLQGLEKMKKVIE